MAFLEFRERSAFWESACGPRDGGRVVCDDHTEGLNRVFSAVRGKARGCCSIANRIIILYRGASKLRVSHTGLTQIGEESRVAVPKSFLCRMVGPEGFEPPTKRL